MLKIPDYISTISLDSTGEVTKSRYMGTFRVKVVLTHADRFKLERNYAEFLPPNVQDVTEELKSRAATLAELDVRIIEAPSWWWDSLKGRNMIDTMPLYDLLRQINDAHTAWLKQLEENANKDMGGALSNDK